MNCSQSNKHNSSRERRQELCQVGWAVLLYSVGSIKLAIRSYYTCNLKSSKLYFHKE